MLLASTTWSCLMALALLSISISDVLYRRIPNNLTLTVLASGMLYWGMRYGFRGVAFASMGVATGLFFLIGFYVLGWLGAGDVKVFAALGAILGAHNIMIAGLFGLMVGGLLCVLYLDEQGPRWHLLPAGKALNYARKTGKTVPLGAALAAGALMTQMGLSI